MPEGPRLGGTFDAEVVIDPQKLAELLRSPSGPVVRRLMADGQHVKEAARQQVGVSPAGPVLKGNRRPGTLRDSIVTRLISHPNPLGFAVMVGSEDPIALIHHEGTEPHLIRARNSPVLVFWWPKIGQLMRVRYVNHPGTQPNRYLTDSLAALRRRYRG